MAAPRVRPGLFYPAAAVALAGWGVLAFGAVYPWAYWPLFVGASAAGLSAVVSARAWHDPRLRAIGLALAVVAATIAVQAVSLPAWLVESLSPGVSAFQSAFQVGYQPSATATLSIAPGATLVALVEWVALALLCLGLARTLEPRGVEWLARQFVGLGLTLAAFGIVQRAFLDPQDPAIYGFWRPGVGAMPFGPFVNRNHFAGWMVMVVPVVAALAWAHVVRQADAPSGARRHWIGRLGSPDGNRILLMSTAVLVMAASVLVSGSRSGAVSLFVGLAVLGLFASRGAEGRRRWPGAAAFVLVFAVALLWAGGPVLERFARASTEVQGRLGAWRDTLHIVQDFPLTGTGLGTYGRAMLVYQTGPRRAIYAEAHNDYLQLAAEGGLLVGVPVLVAVGLIGVGVFRRLRQREEDLIACWVRRGAAAGLAGILVQSSVAFSLQMPGNAVMCGVLLALALARPRSVTHAHRF